jgi:hypothetical protein
MQLIYGERYRIRRTNNEIIEGTHIQTKGDDENYPTFELGTGGRIGVHRDAVLGLASDVAPHGGIPRLVPVDGAEESDGYRADALILDMDAEDRRYNGSIDMEA